LLPPGVHAATLEEVGDAFGQSTDRRVELFTKLRNFVELVRPLKLFNALLVDGSFVTDKTDPNDVDAVLEMPRGKPSPSSMARFFQHLRPAEALMRGVSQDQQRGIVRIDR
jgi:hypothetical protein